MGRVRVRICVCGRRGAHHKGLLKIFLIIGLSLSTCLLSSWKYKSQCALLQFIHLIHFIAIFVGLFLVFHVFLRFHKLRKRYIPIKIGVHNLNWMVDNFAKFLISVDLGAICINRFTVFCCKFILCDNVHICCCNNIIDDGFCYGLNACKKRLFEILNWNKTKLRE